MIKPLQLGRTKQRRQKRRAHTKLRPPTNTLQMHSTPTFIRYKNRADISATQREPQMETTQQARASITLASNTDNSGCALMGNKEKKEDKPRP